MCWKVFRFANNLKIVNVLFFSSILLWDQYQSISGQLSTTPSTLKLNETEIDYYVGLSRVLFIVLFILIRYHFTV